MTAFAPPSLPFFPLKAPKVKLLKDYTIQLDRLITPSIPPIPHPHRQARAGKTVLPAYKLPTTGAAALVPRLHVSADLVAAPSTGTY